MIEDENIMNEDIDRILKGYKPRMHKGSYWILYYLIELITIMRLNFFKMLKIKRIRKLENTDD